MSWLSRLFGRNPSKSAALTRVRERRVKLKPSDVLPLRLSDQPMWSDFSSEAAIKGGLKGSEWAYVCIQKVAKAFGSVPLLAGTYSGDEFTHIPDSPLQALLDQPNEKQSATHWRELTAIELLTTGNSVTCLTRDGNGENAQILEMWNLNPVTVTVIPSRSEHIAGYHVKSGREEFKVSAENAVHTMLPDPENPFWGLSPLQAASRAVDIDRESAKWQKVSLQNMLVPPGVFTVEGIVDDDQFEASRAKLRSRYQESLNARQPLLLGGNVKWQQLSLTPQELDFLNSGKINAEKICAIYGVPLPIAGILDRATYSNITELRSVFWNDTVAPFAKFVCDSLNVSLASHFGDEWAVMPDISKVEALLPVIKRKTEIVKELWSMGVPFNVASRLVDLGVDIGEPGDVGFVPVGVTPADEATAFMSGDQSPSLRVVGDES